LRAPFFIVAGIGIGGGVAGVFLRGGLFALRPLSKSRNTAFSFLGRLTYLPRGQTFKFGRFSRSGAAAFAPAGCALWKLEREEANFAAHRRRGWGFDFSKGSHPVYRRRCLQFANLFSFAGRRRPPSYQPTQTRLRSGWPVWPLRRLHRFRPLRWGSRRG